LIGKPAVKGGVEHRVARIWRVVESSAAQLDRYGGVGSQHGESLLDNRTFEWSVLPDVR
jgi:hypothetical protein